MATITVDELRKILDNTPKENNDAVVFVLNGEDIPVKYFTRENKGLQLYGPDQD